MCMSNKYLKFWLFFCSLFWGVLSAQSVKKHPFLDDTISSWHRFSVEETGVQRISFDFLKQLGIPVDAIDPKTLRVFGRGGQMLPLQNDGEVETLHENAIWVVGEEDGSFDSEDYILFMGYAGDSWNTESQTFANLYHNSADYYITYGTSYGKRVLVVEGTKNTSASTVSSGIYQTAIEEDNYNLGNLGRRWFGMRFIDEQKESFSLQTPNVEEGTTLTVAARVAAVANIKTEITMLAGSESVSSSINPSTSTTIASEPYTQFNNISGMMRLELPPMTAVDVSLSYASGGDFSAIGYLDFLLARYNRKFLGSGGSFLFSLDASSPVQTIVVEQTTPDNSVWELASGTVHTALAEETSFTAELIVDAQSTYYLATDYKTPVFKRSTRKFTPSTSALQMLETTTPLEYLLITTAEFRPQAERLVNHRIEKGLQAQLVSLEDIYQTFSTGQQDIAAIRNFVRYLYHIQGKQLKYLCLFGDTSFDYKNLTSTSDMVVPTFYSLNSFSLTNSFMSDDFFTMMDDGEGLLTASDKMDLAVGRMLFSTAKEAAEVVNKVIEYEDQDNIGNWITKYTLLSDDADISSDKNDYFIQVALDKVGDKLFSEKPFFNINKIHADYFDQVSSSGGDRYPDVQKKLTNTLIDGSLAVNYFGHGGENGLASEFLVDKNLASTLFHPGKYPLFIVITCEFTRFDNHERKTTGELIYQNPVGGAVGLISTTRQIYVSNGINYNDILSKHLFSFGSDTYTSIAEALRRAKSEFSDTNQKRIISYIGDPALKLHMPKRDVKITHLNGVKIEDVTPEKRQLKALDKVTLSGAVFAGNDQQLDDFEGTVAVQFFDKKVERTTQGNDQSKYFTFTELGNKIFTGASAVNKGEFDVTFVVPKDISLNVGEARVSLIAFNQDKSEALGGYSDMLTVGGLNPNPIEDNMGPQVQVFLNDRNFVDGDSVFSSPLLLIDLEDENGINTAGGIGHDITAVLDGNQTAPYVLNTYYSTALDDFTKGSLSFPLNELVTGLHTLTVKAWDTHNNPSTKTVTFWVEDSSKLQIERVYNSPNPVTNQTTFFVQHNRPSELLQAKLYIFTPDGKGVWHDDQDVFSTGYILEGLHWNATSYSGQKLNKGTYLYTIELISTLSQTTDSYSGKLIIY